MTTSKKYFNNFMIIARICNVLVPAELKRALYKLYVTFYVDIFWNYAKYENSI